ncbi:MAG: hypothetical protein GX896_06075 [Clostridiales bacterium]|nr:hypothetical protein [Clostridiales bacterium]
MYQNVNNGGRFNIPPFNNVNYNYVQEPPVDNAPVWFVAAAPLFALFLEKIAFSAYVAIAFWIFAYIVCVLMCIKDRIKVDNYLNSTVNTTRIPKFLVLIPILYLIVRNQKLKNQKQYHIFAIIFFLVAFWQNGLISYSLMTGDSYTQLVKNYYVDDISNFSEVKDTSYKTIEKSIESYLGHNNISWSCLNNENSQLVTAKAKSSYNGEEAILSIVFAFDYDYYKYTEIEIKSVYLNDKELKDEELSAFLTQIFFDDKTADLSGDSIVEV